MKYLVSLLALLIICSNIQAQAPQKMSYQAVIRNSSNNLIATTSIGMQVSVLQGSINGNAVYIETHATTTNVNGLVSVEIGMGTVVSGSFSTIDWSAGPYFIKTETDPLGGTNYTISGTTELMSVPYALFAANSAIGATGVNGIDGVTGATGLPGITGNNGLDGVTGATGAVGATGIAGATGATGNNGIDGVTGATGATGGYNVHNIGESYGGGIVFYVYDGGQHGLIAATADQGTGIQWRNGVDKYSGASKDGVNGGEMNTAIIIASLMGDNASGNFAAKVCSDYSVNDAGTILNDWYLPSGHELYLLYLQKTVVGGFASASYWSSTEADAVNAYTKVFVNGVVHMDPKTNPYRIRPIRKF